MKRFLLSLTLSLLALGGAWAQLIDEGSIDLTGQTFTEDQIVYERINNLYVQVNGLEYGNTKTEIVIPESFDRIFNPSVVVIWIGAFKDQTRIQKITLPETINDISYSAFEGCTSLRSINIPEGVTDIEQKVFRNCI